MAKLFWTVTGDEIVINPTKPEVYSYYIDQLNHHLINQFNTPVFNVDVDVKTLRECLVDISNILKKKFKITCLEIDNLNWCDQKCLNYLHKEWVDLHVKYPTLSNLCEQLEPGSADKFYKINKSIHKLEELFNHMSIQTTNTGINFPNKFGESVLMFGKTNIMIDFNNLGRTLYNKWVNFDNNVYSNDVNNFKELYTLLTVNLSKPITLTAPPEYVIWAKDQNLKPAGNNFGLANFDKLEENLLQYRQLFVKNSQVEKNYITLKD
jgi:hypothetical protein